MQAPRAELCATEGAVERTPEQRLSVNVQKMRAYVNATTSQTVEADFAYLGPTGHEAPLGSGVLRRQFGLKLRAQDACNLVYAMWRIEPAAKLVVSGKKEFPSCSRATAYYRFPKRPLPITNHGSCLTPFACLPQLC